MRRTRTPAFPAPSRLQLLLLRAAVLPASEAGESWSRWRAEGGDLQRMDQASFRLLPQLYRNLREAGAGDPDMDLLKGAYRQAWYANQVTMARGALALRALEDAGIPTLVLKGAAVAQLYYSGVGARPMEDFDVAVPRADAVRAVGVLEHAGFQPDDGQVAVNVIVPLSSSGFIDADGYRVDLHSSVLWQPEADEPFWADAVPLRIRDTESLALCATDQLIHVCAHGARWNSVPALRWASDAIRILDSPSSRIDWDRLVSVAVRARLALPLGEMLDYLRTEFDAQVPEEVPAMLHEVRTSAVERIGHRTLARPPSFRRELGWLALFWDRYSALARLRSERPGLAGFIAFLQGFWGLSSRRDALWRVASWLPRLLLPAAADPEPDPPHRASSELPRMSVVVPFVDEGSYIERCIDSLLAQDYPADRRELIFVDNNSGDGSADIVGRHPELRLMAEPRPGPSAARNRGASAATGDVIAFTDADCVPSPDWLARLADALGGPQTRVVVGWAAPSEAAGALRLISAYERSKESGMRSVPDARAYWGRGGSMGVTRTAWEEYGPFVDVRRGADTLFVQRVLERGSRRAVRFEPRARVDHLEVATVRDYFRKLFAYARGRKQSARLAPTRTLTNLERVRAFRQAVEAERLTAVEAGALLLILTGGLCCWKAGELTYSLGRNGGPG